MNKNNLDLNLPRNTLVAIDISGARNISEEHLLPILQKIKAQTVVLFAAEIEHVFSGEAVLSPQGFKEAFDQITAGGGTNLTPVVEYYRQHNFKHLVVLTDGVMVVPEVPKNLTWVIDEPQNNLLNLDTHLPGEVIFLV